VDRSARDIVLLDRAENPWGPPDGVRAVVAGGRDVSRYPDEQYPRLRRALGARLGVPPDALTFGNGSAELVERAIRTFAGPGTEVISTDPSWFMFDRFCEQQGVVNRKVPFRWAGRRVVEYDLAAVAAGVGPQTRLVYLVNPGNPMGVAISVSAFQQFLDRVPPTLPIVVDEAYIEYSNRPDTVRSHAVVMATDRCVIGLRTFSKFYGLAGLRIGYAFARPATMRLFDRLEPMFSLSVIAEDAAIAALADETHAKRTFDNVVGERARVEARLRAAGLEYVPSEANFMLVEVLGDHDRLFRAFEHEGLYIPPATFFERYVLFPIARPEQNDRTLAVLLAASWH
jgi:histidinol-phosphate aminotransferase